MKKIIISVCVLLTTGIFVYWHFLYPIYARRAKIEALLNRIESAVATQDPAKVGNALQAVLAPDAKIRLEVHFFSITNPGKTMVQDFDKQMFINFIDMILSTVTAYEFHPELSDYKQAEGHHFTIHATSKQWADGLSYYQGVGVNMRFSSDATCEGEVLMMPGEPARVTRADCRMDLRTVPKPEETAKFRDPAILRDFLR